AAQADQLAAQDNVDAAKADLEATRTQLASSEAQVKQTTAALEQTRLDLEHTYIRAPVDGVVVARNVDVGQTVAASLQTPTLFQIAQDLTKMQVDTNVSEADVGRVKVGQPVTFTVDAYPGQVFKGQVAQIREAPINVQNVITYDVVIAVANPDLKLFPGMTANEKILVDTHGDVLKVANAALRFQPSAAAPNPGGGKPGSAGSRKAAASQTIWALQASGKLKPVVVTLGLTDGNFTEITGDLKEGDQVVVAAFSTSGSSGPAPPAAGSKRGPQF
ncbi:MAG TPA: efflux RND transporter periplasmic adaptor subunit, partial [Bryobacteraceae bacterium]|nr:efflux RND transporter periplasmic adaptor subunit [Bryobacteraceae bacterium]